MNKQVFLETLKRELSGLPVADVAEILRDQEEYIRDAVRAGRTEDEVIRSLGDPRVFAQNLSVESKISKAEKPTALKNQISTTWSAVIAVLALAPLNLIFVLGPFIGLLALVFGVWMMALGILLASIAVLVTFFIKMIAIPVGFWTHLSAFFFAAGWVGVGILGVVFMAIMTRFFLLGTIAYLKWNVNFVRARS